MIGLNTADTHIIFKSQVDIPTNGSNSGHYIMYGNPSPGLPAPLTNTNVYLWYDDFSTDPFSGAARYNRSKAADIHGSGYASPSYDAVNQRVNFDTGDNQTADMYVDNVGFSNGERDVLIAVDHFADLNYPTNATDAIVVRVNAINTSSTHEYLHYSHGSYPASPAIAWDSGNNGERNTLGGSASPVPYWPFNSARTWAFASFGTTARFWEDGDLDAEPWFTVEVPLLSGSTTAPQSGYMGVAPAQSRGWWDNLIIRRYTEPEPALSFAAEEMLFANMIIGKAVNPSGTQSPSTDLTYTITITNTGNTPAVNVVVTDTLPGEVDFQVGSVVNNLPAGIGVTVEYSDDGGTTWTYVPTSTGCSAPTGYDGCVQNIRWTLLNDLDATPPDNTGTLEFVSRIR